MLCGSTTQLKWYYILGVFEVIYVIWIFTIHTCMGLNVLYRVRVVWPNMCEVNKVGCSIWDIQPVWKMWSVSAHFYMENCLQIFYRLGQWHNQGAKRVLASGPYILSNFARIKLTWNRYIYFMIQWEELKVHGPIFQNLVFCFIWRIITQKMYI